MDIDRMRAKIEDVIAGDALTIRRTIDRAASKLAAGVTIVKAWLTIKDKFDDDDPGLVQKVITTTGVPGTGQIENDGTGDTDPIVRFDLSGDDTILLTDVEKVTAGLPTEKYFDVQVLTSSGGPYTGLTGRIYTSPQVTKASS